MCFSKTVTDSAMEIDGRLDEEAWQQAVPHTTFTQRDRNEGESATEETAVRVLYDDDSLNNRRPPS